MTKRIVIGFDGFVDTLIHCVDRRTGPHSYRRLASVEQFVERVGNAIGKSTNIECLSQGQTLGGNAPILAQALVSLGHAVDLIGTLGFPQLHPVFSPLSSTTCFMHSIGEPGFTDALEFTDGKILLGKVGEVGSLPLTTIFSRLHELDFSKLIDESCLIATANWTMMPAVEEFWRWLSQNRHLLTREKILFVDLADPAKRSKEDLQGALEVLSDLNRSVKVMLGLNRSECEQIYNLFSKDKIPESLVEIATSLLSTLRLHTVVIHTHYEAAAVSNAEVASALVPHTATPKRSTGAGDTFNGGFLSAILHEKSLQTCLEWAIKASGILVRTGNPPTPEQLIGQVAGE